MLLDSFVESFTTRHFFLKRITLRLKDLKICSLMNVWHVSTCSFFSIKLDSLTFFSWKDNYWDLLLNAIIWIEDSGHVYFITQLFLVILIIFRFIVSTSFTRVYWCMHVLLLFIALMTNLIGSPIRFQAGKCLASISVSISGTSSRGLSLRKIN